ncbi:MAG: ROK family protein [Prevotellaceae bacterium]|jgi:glucokinase|nr:ROK family protein [Prevotellaceae bacterium]
MQKPYVIGVDIGAQTAKIGIVNVHGNVIEQTAIRSNSTADVEEFVDDLCEAIIKLLPEEISLKQIKAIGIGAPNANYYTGMIENASNLKWGSKTKQIPLVEMLSKKIDISSVMTNDANAAAIGEMTYGATKGMKNFIMITLGTGIGSGIVVDGRILYGHDGFAGELGHVTMVRGSNARLCNCGRTGCLETYASAIGVARSAREILETTDSKSLLRNLPVASITSKDVFEAAIKGDDIAKEIFNITGKILGEVFANFVAFSSPEAIVLFGGLTKAGNLIYKPIVEHLNLNLLPIWQGKIRVLLSKLKESNAAILGAGALAWGLQEIEN